MLTAKENYLKTIRGEKPERVPLFPDDVNFFIPTIWDADPESKRDFFGVKWIEEKSGLMPDVIHPVLTDVTKWREAFSFPDLSKLDWEGIAAKFNEDRDPDKITIGFLHASGPFLLPINMLGWEEGLAALYEEPEEMEALISAIVDFLIELAGYIDKYIQPELYFSGDDLAAANGPMISRELWRTIYKPQFKRIVDAVHGFGAYVEFHNCGNNGYLIEEFKDLGVDVCQLPMPNDDLLADRKRFGNKLVITGGWDRICEAAKAGATEEQVRASAREAVDKYGKDGALIFWDGGVIGDDEEANNKKNWLYDEVRVYGTELYSKG